MRIPTVAVLFILAFAAVARAQEPICPPREVGPNEPEELFMHETDSTVEKAQDSVKFLRTEFAKRIWGPEPVKDFGAWSGHYISYANSLRFIEGALLKQRTLALRAQAELLAEQRSSSGEARAAQSSFESAKEVFCTFVQNSIYVD